MFFLTFLSVPWQDVNGDGYVYKNLNKGVPDKQGSSCRANIHSFQRKNQTNKQKNCLGVCYAFVSSEVSKLYGTSYLTLFLCAI